MSERGDITRNFRHPILEEIPIGVEMETPDGVPCYVAGRSDENPGRFVVVFDPDGDRHVREMWPAKLRGFKVNGRTL